MEKNVTDTPAPIPARSWMGLREGERIPSGSLIHEVLHVSEKCGVFIVEGENLQWALDPDVVNNPGAAVAEASALVAQTKTAVGGKLGQRRALKVVGAALAQALEAPVDQRSNNLFSEARAFVAATQRETLQTCYLAAAFAAVTLLAPMLAISGRLAADEPRSF